MSVTFERLDKKIDASVEGMNKRFDSVDRRFDSIDQRFHGIDQQFQGIDQKFNAMDQKFTDRFESVERAIATTRLWSLSTLVTFTAVILATMARGFGWL